MGSHLTDCMTYPLTAGTTTQKGFDIDMALRGKVAPTTSDPLSPPL